MNSPQATETRRRRGRPAAGDPERVALLALRRFASHGYEATTMESIAELAGIGRRTLFRYFPSKPDLVWGGMEPVVERMHRVLDSPGAGESTRDVIARAMTESLDLDPDTLEATRLRLRLMASDPALIAFGVLRLTASRDLIAGFLGRRLGADASELRVRVVADAISSANFSALLWWATNRDDDDPARASVEALDALLDLHLP